MATYAPPSVTEVRDTPTIATLREAINKRSIPQAYRNALLCQMFLGGAKEPGLEIQGQDLKLPKGRRPKTKTMAGKRATAFVNFEAGITFQWVEGTESLNTSMADGPVECYTDFSYASIFVAIGGIDQVENSGPMKRLDLLLERQDQEMRGMTTGLETALWSTNTDAIRGSQGQFSGMRHKVSTAPTSGTLEGLSRTTFTPWRNQYNASGGSVATGGLDAIRAMVLACSGTNSMEPPHLIITDRTTYGALLKQLEGIHRVVGSLNGQDLMAERMAMVMGIPICWTDDCPTGYMYFFNFDYIVSILQKNAQWVEKRPGYPNDQWLEDQVRWFFGAAPLLLTRPERLGVISGFTA